jgi:predicted transcriptional regulator
VARDTQITVYVDDEMKERLDERVEDSNETISSYANKAIDQRLQAEANDELAREVRAEERIRELVSIATDEMKQATEEMRDLNAKTGAYAAANFELLKSDYKDATRRDALSTGSRRMRTDLDVVQDELGNGVETDDTRPEPDANVSTADGGDSERKGPFERMREDNDVRE